MEKLNCASENVNIEIWKNENRKGGALKAQLQSAQGSALGNCVHPPISAPCKGNYIYIKICKNGNMERSCPF
jgi:hypothetical protein